MSLYLNWGFPSCPPKSSILVILSKKWIVISLKGDIFSKICLPLPVFKLYGCFHTCNKHCIIGWQVTKPFNLTCCSNWQTTNILFLLIETINEKRNIMWTEYVRPGCWGCRHCSNSCHRFLAITPQVRRAGADHIVLCNQRDYSLLSSCRVDCCVSFLNWTPV